MSVFKQETESKRMIFNVRMDIAARLEEAKKGAKELGRKLDYDGAVNEALEKFLKKAEKRLGELLDDRQRFRSMHIGPASPEESPVDAEASDEEAGNLDQDAAGEEAAGASPKPRASGRKKRTKRASTQQS